jgi:hypothetical protein
MKKLFLLLTVFVLSNNVISQKSFSKIELKLFQRIDWYPGFSYNVGGRPSNDFLKMRGISWGAFANIKYPLSKQIKVKAGLGFYNYSFNHLENENSLFGKGKSREIDYPSTMNLNYTTDRYYYRSILVNIGIEKEFFVRHDLVLAIGSELNNYYTISQKYHLTYRGINYKRNENAFFGHSIVLNSSLFKKTDKIEIGPSLIVPVFDIWKQDVVFPEENSADSRTKWFSGIGLGISINFLISKKQNHETINQN